MKTVFIIIDAGKAPTWTHEVRVAREAAARFAYVVECTKTSSNGVWGVEVMGLDAVCCNYELEEAV